MTLKLNISHKGKAWKVELEPETLSGSSIGDKIQGKTVKPELEGYELEITGGSDASGFPMSKDTEGIGLQKKLLTRGWGMHTKPKGLRKKQPKLKKGMRLRKTVRGKTISEKTIQLNIKVIKEGTKPLNEIFPDQNKPKEEPKKKEEAPATQKEQPKSTAEPQPTTQDSSDNKGRAEKQDNNKKEEKQMSEDTKEEIAEEIAEEVKEEIKEDMPSSPETKTEEEKKEAAEKVAEEVKEDVEEVAEDIAEDEEKKE